MDRFARDLAHVTIADTFIKRCSAEIYCVHTIADCEVCLFAIDFNEEAKHVLDKVAKGNQDSHVALVDRIVRSLLV